jgi:hypothetical protein
MPSPQQFLESFLRDTTAAWAVARPHLSAVYSKYFGGPLSHQAERFMPNAAVRAEVEEVTQSDGVASVVTREHFTAADIRTRYRLAPSGESWRIVGIDRECLVCRGTGQSCASRCRMCDGMGWRDRTVASVVR